MNTNQLKKFAQEARRKLLEQVGAKLNFVLTTDSAELREKTEQLKQLRLELGRTTKEQLIEKVAYTWFNRLMALRFMDVNDYQPLGIRIITPKDGYTIPELLDEAKRGNIPDELKVNRQKIYDLLDNKIPSSKPQNETYKELLIASCNHLHTTFPFLFEKINDYTELLLPDDLTSEFSIVNDVREGMSWEDCQKVEMIGWLYQFYISEKKDEVIGTKCRIKKEDIPAATQLFTPRWIVEYMVQNTLGRLWLQNRPKSRLREYMQYFIESASNEAEDYLKINSPEEIKFLDPASGSGHILVYAFDLLTKIYEEEGYNTNEIPQLIIENNLCGFEIDERASQLSALTLMMKAREYNRRAFRESIFPNVICFQDLPLNISEIKRTTETLKIYVSDEFLNDLITIQQGKNFGSLIQPHADKKEIVRINESLSSQASQIDIFESNIIFALLTTCRQLLFLAEKYHCVVTNPPYMGNGNMNNELSAWVKDNYPESKADLFSCFINRSLNIILKNGYCGLVTMESWMFLPSFEMIRLELINNYKIHSLSHFGWHIMRIAFGTVAFITQKSLPNDNFMGIYSYLEIGDIDKERDRPYIFPKKDNNRYRTIIQKDFIKIPSSPLAYWLNQNMLTHFSRGKSISDDFESGGRIKTHNNDKYLRFTWEVPFSSIGRNGSWICVENGGDYRKWFGNVICVVHWTDMAKENYAQHGGLSNPKFWERRGITWGIIASNQPSFRLKEEYSEYTSASPVIIPNRNGSLFKILGLLNSKYSIFLLKLLNPTFNNTVGDVLKLPILNIDDKIEELCIACIDISRKDWNIKEISIDFRKNELIRIKQDDDITFEESMELYQQFWINQLSALQRMETEINSIINASYGIENDFSSNVPLSDITIQKDEIDIIDGSLKINYQEVIFQFISYAVGCFFGRFNTKKEGFVIVSPKTDISNYLKTPELKNHKLESLPDEDNIIPILDDEWFEDDIVGKFYHFLRVTFGEKNFNKNLAFIEEQIGKDIRRYFIKDFYHDHIKRYKKRPIYWMFSSPKGSFNVLIYMHRYTPDTVSNILNKYLKEFMGKLNTRKEHLEHVQVTGSTSDITKAIKEIDNIDKMLVELHEYERDILYPLATERIEIDLDDGVLVNYNKFGKAVKEVNGLNDPATKKKVRQFDWINTSQIR